MSYTGSSWNQELRIYKKWLYEWYKQIDECDKLYRADSPVDANLINQLASRIRSLVENHGPSFRPADGSSPSLGYSHKVVEHINAIVRQVRVYCALDQKAGARVVSGRDLFYDQVDAYLRNESAR